MPGKVRREWGDRLFRLACLIRRICILDQLNRRAVLFDEGHHHTQRGAVGRDDHVFSPDGLPDVGDLKGNVRDLLDDFRQRAARFVAHPLNPELTFFVAAVVELEFRQVDLSWQGLGGGNSNMVIAIIFIDHASLSISAADADWRLWRGRRES